MHLKRNGNSVSLYRSLWVPKSKTVSHGYSKQKYVCSLPADSEDAPEAVLNMLTDAEQAWLHEALLAPNRTRRAEAEAELKRRELDPVWRIQEAVDLLNAAANLSSIDKGVPMTVAANLRAVVERLDANSRTSNHCTDPLRQALDAIRSATTAVKQGRYPRAPREGFQSSQPAKLWQQIQDAAGGTEDSLRLALQAAGYVKRRAAG